jgi:hypothetical protein
VQNVGYQVTAIARTIVELPNGERRPFSAWLAVDVNGARACRSDFAPVEGNSRHAPE